ncbi:hypothetical protein HPB50_005451 [Hyalomma asiaticum]|uniref:Uncharacterized protein n=1 Tax=Hyalomma asiaticum TaxID=266040 RepID=A0ACB7SVX1_HYAAI|nr:hypothetical protein HPB50_005451 [Hyalomma asiaticum]
MGGTPPSKPPSFLHHTGVMAAQEEDADATSFYIRLSGDLDPEPAIEASACPAGVPAVRTALAPPKPPHIRTAKPVQAAFPSNWSSTRGRPDHALRYTLFRLRHAFDYNASNLHNCVRNMGIVISSALPRPFLTRGR